MGDLSMQGSHLDQPVEEFGSYLVHIMPHSLGYATYMPQMRHGLGNMNLDDQIKYYLKAPMAQPDPLATTEATF